MQYNENDYSDNFKEKLLALIDNKYRDYDKKERRKLFKKDYSSTYNIDEKKFNNTSNEWLTGRNLASLDNLLRICSFFDCDIEYLITKQDVFSKGIANASEETGLAYTTIDELKSLPISEKHIVDAIWGRTIISTNLIKTIKEMLFYSHPLTRNNSYILLDKSLTARDKDYEQLEIKINENQIIDILSQRLSIEMREIIEALSKDKKLSDEILEDYKNKFFTYHRHVLTAEELPKFITDDNGNLIIDIDSQIYRIEEKILDRLERRYKKGKSFDYGINIHNYSDFKKCIQKYRVEKTKEDYLSWLKHIDSETE